MKKYGAYTKKKLKTSARSAAKTNYENRISDGLAKAAKGVMVTAVAAVLIFTLGSDSILHNFFIYETMPFYNMKTTIPVFFKYGEDELISADDETISRNDEITNTIEMEAQEVFQTFNPDNIETINEISFDTGIVGINDVVFQDEAEFGALPEVVYKQNFTAASLNELADIDYFISSFYIKESATGIIKEKFDAVKFFNTNLKTVKDATSPQVLIFHTHAGTEYFSDSNTSDLYEGVVGTGEQLKYVLEQKYGIRTIHYSGVFDMVDGKSNRDGSYERMEPVIQKILDENPTIEVVIDLHRDGIEPNPNLVTIINGKPCAKLMFVNGVCAKKENGEAKEITSLQNPYLDTNLALSFNMQIAANEMYPDLTRKIYLKPYRFSTHMKAKSLLVEIGSQYNTKEEANNAMEVLADLIESVVFDS